MTSTPISLGSDRSMPTVPTSDDSHNSQISAAPDKTLQSIAGSPKALKTYISRSARKLEDSATKENVPLAESRSRSRASRTKSSCEVVISPVKRQKTTPIATREEKEEREWETSEVEVGLPKSLSLSQNDERTPSSQNQNIESFASNNPKTRPKIEIADEGSWSDVGREDGSTGKGRGKEKGKEYEAIDTKPKLEDDGEALMPVSNSTLSRLPRSSGPSPEPQPEPLVMKQHSALPQHSFAQATQDYASSSPKIAARLVSITSEASTTPSGSSVKVRKRSIVQDEEEWNNSGVSPLNKQFKMEHGSKKLSRTDSLTAFTSSRHLRQPSLSTQRCVSTPSTSQRNRTESVIPSKPSPALESENDFPMPFKLPTLNLNSSPTLEPSHLNSPHASPSISASLFTPSASIETELLKLGEGFSFFPRGCSESRQLDFLASIFRLVGWDNIRDLKCMRACEAEGVMAMLRESYEKRDSVEGRVAEVDWTRMRIQLRKGLEKKEESEIA